MKGKFLALAAVGAMAFAFSSVPASAHHIAVLGNDLPHISGKVEKLHLHAYDGCQSNPHDTNEGSNGGNVIVLDYNIDGRNGLLGKNDIELVVNGDWPNFAILDGNACDNDPAMFNLPSDALFDEPTGTETGEWAVLVRMRGQPGSKFAARLCYTDGTDIVCDVGTVDIIRGNGKPSVTDVTRKLLGFDDLADLEDEKTQQWWEIGPGGRMRATLYFYDCDDLDPSVTDAC